MITIKQIHIKNFRSIVDETFDLTAFNCFVGKNDSGKSNVLKALNLFFNGETDFNTPFNFEDDYSKFAKNINKKAKEVIIALDIIVPENFADCGIKTWEKRWRNGGLSYNNIDRIVDSKKSKVPTYLKRIKYTYVPAVKSNEYFKELLLKLYYSMTKAANTGLIKESENYSAHLRDMTSELTDKIKGVLSLESVIQMPKDLSVLFRDLSFSVGDKYIEDVDIKRRGDGIKARHIPSILRYIQENIESGRQHSAVKGSYIWGYEEPENGVEYGAAFDMAEEFFNYRSSCQELITTHSPAFYTKAENKLNEGARVFFTYKDTQGISKYIQDKTRETVDKEIGLMPLIAPYVKDYLKQLHQAQDKINSLNKEIGKSLKQIIILTEGKTDAVYLQVAQNVLGITELSMEYIDTGCGGYNGLDDTLEKVSTIIPTKKVIGIFDRDEDVILRKYSIDGDYTYIGDNVYAMIIPQVNQEEFGDKISIEHYFSRAELSKSITGKRLFLGDEFFGSGNSKDGCFQTKFSGIQHKVDINGIIDDKVYHSNDLEHRYSVALSKNDFANYVAEHPEEFNFENFRKIFDVIAEIARDNG